MKERKAIVELLSNRSPSPVQGAKRTLIHYNNDNKFTLTQEIQGLTALLLTKNENTPSHTLLQEEGWYEEK